MRDIESRQGSFPLNPSKLEDIDASVLDWVKDKKLQTTTNEGFSTVPVLWVSEERSHQVKNRKELRDKFGTMILPAIAVERTGFERDLKDKGSYRRFLMPEKGYDPRGGMITVAHRIKQDKTANFQNADSMQNYSRLNFPRKKNNKVVYEYITMPMPIYVVAHYEINIATEYQQQMNDLVQPFVTDGYGFSWISLVRNGHRYEGFIEEGFDAKNNGANLGQDRRRFETTVKLKVLGYVIGAGENEERPIVTVREGVTEVKITGERTMLKSELQ